MTNSQLEKLSFYSLQDAQAFASLLEIATHSNLERVRFVAYPTEIVYRVRKERFIKKFGYWY